MMMRTLIFSITFFCIPFLSFSQTTYDLVYNLFQAKCTDSDCHTGASPAGRLDLSASKAVVYADLIDQPCYNPFASAYTYVEPGTPRRSFLFKKINNGLEPYFNVTLNQGTSMPDSFPLTNTEVELVRQWIIWGAPDTGMVVDTQVIYDYYNSGDSKPFVIVPPPPDTSVAYFVHAGPYFLRPGEEVEFSRKHEIRNNTDIDVNRVDTKVNDEAHHTAMYKFNPGLDTMFDRGLRIMTGVADAAAVFFNANVIAQFPNDRDLVLPPGSAFKWEANTVLDLNYHLLNYNNTGILPAEFYINFYYDTTGSAQYEMESAPIYYGGQNISALVIPPNTDTTFTMEQYVPNAVDSSWSIWAIMAHTHALGTSFDVWKRNSNGTKGDQIYHGSYDETHTFDTGVYDWEHPPAAEYLPLHEIDMSEGLIHEAGFNNTTNNTVGFGLTTEDEMYVTYIHYINGKYVHPNAVEELSTKDNLVQVYPNPATDVVLLSINQNLDYQNAELNIYDIMGKQVKGINISRQHRVSIDVESLQSGMYFFELSEKNQLLSQGKFMIAR